MARLFIGLMSGTSVDAIDAVLMDFSASDRLVAHFSQPIDPVLKSEINRIIAARAWPQDTATLDQRLVEASVQAIHRLLEEASIRADQIEAVGSHGQTVFHDPEGAPPVSIQLGDAREIACTAGIPTVGNFRQADIDAGGQDAPLACAYHARLFRSRNEDRAVLNLGGIANLTFLPSDPSQDVTGFDTGPANTLSDAWIQHCRALDFDHDGEWAKSGSVNRDLLEQMLEDPYFERPPPKSTGRETFNLTWLRARLARHGTPLAHEDVQATLVELTAQSAALGMQAHPGSSAPARVLLCGGGGNNAYLVSRLEHAMAGMPVERTDVHGVPSKWLEAMTFAWLAKRAVDGEPANLPSVTGARRAVVLGEVHRAK